MDFKLQGKAVSIVNEKMGSWRSKVTKRKNQLDRIYEATMDYYPPKRKEYETNLKVNFCNYIEQLVTARITAKAPKFIVNLAQNPREVASMYMKEDAEGFNDFVKEVAIEWSPRVQRYLDMMFKNFDAASVLEMGAKQLIRNGNCYGMPVYKYKTYKKLKKNKDGKKVMVEKIAQEYPIIEIVPLSELFFDPRYHQLDESDGVIRRKDRVRLSQLLAMKDQEGMMNLERIRPTDEFNTEKSVIYNIMIPGAQTPTRAETLMVDQYYGYFNDSDDPAREMLWELWVVNGSMLIKANVITEIPIVSGFAFGDPEQHFGIGFVEPILGLQDEYNFKMNAAVQAINNNLNQTYLWDPNCGIAPNDIEYANAPGYIITAHNGVEQAQQGFQQIQRQTIDPAYFSNQNEIRSDMQTVSFTIDAGNPLNNAGTTDTATAVRAKFFDSNVVYSNVLKHYEQWLVKIAYKVLDMVAENYREDKIITELGKWQYEWLDKVALEESPIRYAISVVVGSSSFDSQENRREDAIAKTTIAKEAIEAGVPLDATKFYGDTLSTFEGFNMNNYMKDEMDVMGMMGPQPGGQTPPGLPEGMGLPPAIQDGMDLGRFGTVLDADPQLDDISQLSSDVVQGTIQPQAGA